MSRFLFVAPPLMGHLNPARTVAAVLSEQGHEVAWAGSEATLRPLLGAEATIYRTGTRIHRAQADQGLESVKSVWERFIVPYTRFTLPAVQRAVTDYRPDVLVSDQITPAGALVAHRHGLPWATLVCSTIDLCRPYSRLPKVERWMSDQLARLWTEAGLPASELIDVRFSPYLVIAFTGRELTGPLMAPADGGQVRLVGPAIGQRAGDPEFPWDWLDPARRHVLVTMGTLATELAQSFNTRAVAAFAPMAQDLQAIVLGEADTVTQHAENVLMLPRAPVLEMLPRMDVVVSHGGLNTVCESLAHGVPLVVAPIRHDQPVNARQVVEAGAGVRVRFARVSPAELGTAVRTVLDDARYREAAGRIAASFAAAGGAVAAAESLQRLATTPRIAAQIPASSHA
ncbi:MAG TPA: glycosyltransferase [Jatrophihabitans sp.]|jgi:MGT family glycosyltransferase|nr:glycosyltransferase [Jatrophihabitans sp.]